MNTNDLNVVVFILTPSKTSENFVGVNLVNLLPLVIEYVKHNRCKKETKWVQLMFSSFFFREHKQDFHKYKGKTLSHTVYNSDCENII